MQSSFPRTPSYPDNDQGRAHFSEEDGAPPRGRRSGRGGPPPRFPDDEDLPPAGRHTARPGRSRQPDPDYSDDEELPAPPRRGAREPQLPPPPPRQQTIGNGNAGPGRSHGFGAMTTTGGPSSRAVPFGNARQLQIKGQPPQSRAGGRHENHSYDPTEALSCANPSPVPGQLHLHIYSFSQAFGCPCEKRAPDTQLLAVIDCTRVRKNRNDDFKSGKQEAYQDWFFDSARNGDFFHVLEKNVKKFIKSRDGIHERWALYIGDWDGTWGSVAIAEELVTMLKKKAKSVAFSCDHLDLVKRGVGR